jgi:hypothetical protein
LSWSSCVILGLIFLGLWVCLHLGFPWYGSALLSRGVW